MRRARIRAMCKPRRRSPVVREPYPAKRERFVEQGLEAALERNQQTHQSQEPILAGEQEARLIQLAYSEPPQDRRGGHCGGWPRSW